ncbi:MAG: hypothetical protein ACLR8Y_16120 [Alistipes indistinctus]
MAEGNRFESLAGSCDIDGVVKPEGMSVGFASVRRQWSWCSKTFTAGQRCPVRVAETAVRNKISKNTRVAGPKADL